MPEAADPSFQFYSESWLVHHTGVMADSLRTLLKGLRTVSGSSIFYHVHNSLFRRHYTTSRYMNDFGRWAWVTMHEERLAEQLAVIDPLEFVSVREARERLVGVVERYLGDAEYIQRVLPGQEFHFGRLQTFVFPTGVRAGTLEELAERVRVAAPDVVFYHFVEAHLRHARKDNDFSVWVRTRFGADDLADAINALSPYTYDLWALRERIADLVEQEAA